MGAIIIASTSKLSGIVLNIWKTTDNLLLAELMSLAGQNIVILQFLNQKLIAYTLGHCTSCVLQVNFFLNFI